MFITCTENYVLKIQYLPKERGSIFYKKSREEKSNKLYFASQLCNVPPYFNINFNILNAMYSAMNGVWIMEKQHI